MSKENELPTVLITGANSGIGLAASKQVALKESTKRVILGCRSGEKAAVAKSQLEGVTGTTKFEVLKLDVTDHESVRSAVEELQGSIDCLILNAGGVGGKDFAVQNSAGIANIMALNVVGNAFLVNELLKSKKLTKGGTIVYSSSEVARGVKNMGFPTPEIKSGSVDEFQSAINGTLFSKDKTSNNAYSWAKCVGTLWTSGMARSNGDYRWISVSPGSTAGTNLLRDANFIARGAMKIGWSFLKLIGVSHGPDMGAKRYLDVVYEMEKYSNGKFYGSKDGKVSGELVDQTPIFEDLGKEEYQDNAVAAVERFF